MRRLCPAIAASALAVALTFSPTTVAAKPKQAASRVHHATPNPRPKAATAAHVAKHVAHAKRVAQSSRIQRPHPRRRVASTRPVNHHVIRLARPLILIDPGHGGPDSGAVGASGLREKDVTLATALELQRQLSRMGRYRVELTRAADHGVSLASRVGRAWAERPALFISIHADASPDRTARGASVYVRNEALAGAAVTKLPATPAASRAIGRALSTGSPRPSAGSTALQVAIVEQLKDDVAMVHDPAREAHLYVLGAVGVPGVLVEVGFVSNRHEEHLLRTARYRQTVARALRDAIGDYFNKTTFAVADKS